MRAIITMQSTWRAKVGHLQGFISMTRQNGQNENIFTHFLARRICFKIMKDKFVVSE